MSASTTQKKKSNTEGLSVNIFSNCYNQWLSGGRDNPDNSKTIKTETKQTGGVVYTLREIERRGEQIYVLSCMTERALGHEVLLKAWRLFGTPYPIFIIQFVNIADFIPSSLVVAFNAKEINIVNAAAQQLLVSVASHASYRNVQIQRLSEDELHHALCHMLKKNGALEIPIIFLHDVLNRCYFFFADTYIQVTNLPVCGGTAYYKFAPTKKIIIQI